jgi:serine/threonine protein kinase
MTAPEGQVDPFIGRLLADKYQIVRQIGHGGMGDVYQGIHVLMERPVAIKVMHARWVSIDPACLTRFKLEAKASSCLNHPNIMAVFDFGITDTGVAYLVMDYIDGIGLDVVLRKDGRLTLQQTVNLFSQACDGLSHAHSKGVVHRDLKPSNLMVVNGNGGDLQLKIVDFGIAKLLPGNSHSLRYSVRDSQVVGSPLYMSPEQCKGDASLDSRSDIYSLGCLMYHALTGRPPVVEETVLSIIYAHLNQTPRPFGLVAADLGLPPQIEAVIFKALSKDPAQRQQSMQELKQQLQAAYAESQKIEQQLPDPVADAAPKLPPDGKSEDRNGPSEDGGLAHHLHNLADFYQANHQPERAEQHLKAAVRCLVEAYGVWDLRVAEAVKKLADFYRDTARFADAEPLYVDLLQIKRSALGSRHPELPCLLLRIAEVNFRLHDFERSERYYGRCLRLSEQLFGADDPALAPVLTGYAGALRRLSRYGDAARVHLRALSLKEMHLGPDHFDLAPTLVGLGVVYRMDERFAEAEAALQRALTIYETSVGAEHQHVATVVLLIAELYSVQGRNVDAERLYSRAVTIRQKISASKLEVAAAYDVWAAHYLRIKDLLAAERAYKTSLSLKEVELGGDHPDMAGALSVLAALYQAQNRSSDAEVYYQKAVDCAKNKVEVKPAKP